MGNQTFIEINGKKYDAITGRLLTAEKSDQPAPVVKLTPSTGVVDGFVRRTSPSRSVTKPTKAPQRSHTLARNAVKKPLPKTKAPQSATIKTLITKPSLQPSSHRVARAAQITKSPQIKKFDQNESPRTSVIKQSEHQAVAVYAPKNDLPTISKSTPSPQHPSHKETLLEAALGRAATHEEAHHHTKAKKRSGRVARKLGVSRRAISVSAGILSAVLLVGFFAVQNVPNLSMRVASARAGFAAEMPAYTPAGFSFRGPINYRSGQVKVTFRSNVDNRQYDLVQTSSNWNSDALLANFISAEKKQYQTYLDKGRTLYIYDGTNATWVDNGVWYQVEGNASLTTDQLIRIASSL